MLDSALMKLRSLSQRWVRRTFLLFVLVAFIHSSGCARVIFDLRAECCVNPPDGRCNQECSDARIIQLRVYQLKKDVDTCTLRWDDFRRGLEADALKGMLADPQGAPLVQNVDRREWRTVPAWELSKDTTHLLIVTVGRAAGPKSIRKFDLGLIRRRQIALHFDRYDVCINERCVNEPPEGQCR